MRNELLKESGIKTNYEDKKSKIVRNYTYVRDWLDAYPSASFFKQQKEMIDYYNRFNQILNDLNENEVLIDKSELSKDDNVIEASAQFLDLKIMTARELEAYLYEYKRTKQAVDNIVVKVFRNPMEDVLNKKSIKDYVNNIDRLVNIHLKSRAEIEETSVERYLIKSDKLIDNAYKIFGKNQKDKEVIVDITQQEVGFKTSKDTKQVDYDDPNFIGLDPRGVFSDEPVPQQSKQGQSIENIFNFVPTTISNAVNETAEPLNIEEPVNPQEEAKYKVTPTKIKYTSVEELPQIWRDFLRKRAEQNKEISNEYEEKRRPRR